MGTTLDDSVGEAFDKVARLLGLDVTPSGGPALEAFAKHGDPHAVPLTMPLHSKRTCDFSYSGLKTGVLVACEERGTTHPTPENFQVTTYLSFLTWPQMPLALPARALPGCSTHGNTVAQERADMAASFQRVAVEQLAHRLKYATQWAREEAPEIDTLVVAGGVAANTTLRIRIEEVALEGEYRTVYPPPRLCTDNGARTDNLVLWCAWHRGGAVGNLTVSKPISARSVHGSVGSCP